MKPTGKTRGRLVSLIGLLGIIVFVRDVAGERWVTPDNYRQLGFDVTIRIGRKAVFYEMLANTEAYQVGQDINGTLLLGARGESGGCEVAGESSAEGTKYSFGLPFERVDDSYFVFQKRYVFRLAEFIQSKNLFTLDIETFLLPSRKIKIILTITALVNLYLGFNDTCTFVCNIDDAVGNRVVTEPETCGAMLTSLHIPAGGIRSSEFVIPRFGAALQPGEYVISAGVAGDHNKRFLPWKSVKIYIPRE